jgi:hypothetical protein
MALTEKNQLLIAFKKLYGKSHTSAKFGIFNESIGSSVQLGSSTIFGNLIPSAPSSSLYSITEGTVEKIEFTLEPIALSTYASTLGALAGTTIDNEGNTAVNGVHAYKLVLPSNYVSNSSNTKKGTGVFLNSTVLSDTNGALQLVPPSFGDLYSAQVSSSSGVIGGLDDEDYYLDYYSGILFIQDIGRTPTAVTAYAYVGNFVSDLLSDTSSDYVSEVIAGTNLTGGGTEGTVTVSLADNIILTSVTASLYGTASYALNAATASYITASNIGNFTADVRSQFSAGTNIDITSGVISTVNVPTQAQVSGALLNYATLSGVSSSFATPSQISGAIANFATRADVTGVLAPYALSSDVTASFATPAQVTASFSVVTAKNAETASYIPTGSAIATFKNDVQAQFSAGSNLTYATGTYALNNNINLNSVTASFSGSGVGITGVVSASYATTASYAENTSFDVTGIQNAYKRLRYQEVAFFTNHGGATIQLPTSSLGGAAFPTSSLDYINVNVSVLDSGAWVNDMLAATLYVSASYVYIDLWAPGLKQTDQYRILAINEDPSLFVI